MFVLIVIDNNCKIRFITTATTLKRDGYHRFGFTINEIDFTLLAAILTIGGYNVRQKQKLVAERIANSRIEWLKLTRDYFSKYISNVSSYRFYSAELLQLRSKIPSFEKNMSSNHGDEKADCSKNRCSIFKPKANKIIFDITKKSKKNLLIEKKIVEYESLMNESLNKANEFYYKLIFSLNPNEDITERITFYQDHLEDGVLDKNQFHSLTAELATYTQEYFKGEWDKAKKEIEYGVTLKSKSKVKPKINEFSKVLNNIMNLDDIYMESVGSAIKTSINYNGYTTGDIVDSKKIDEFNKMSNERIGVKNNVPKQILSLIKAIRNSSSEKLKIINLVFEMRKKSPIEK